MDILENVELGVAVHYRMFSWRTACGKVFDSSEKGATDRAVTCKVCLRSGIYDYDYLGERGPFGIGVIGDPYGVAKYTSHYSVGNEMDANKLHHYVVRLFHALEQTERVEINAQLPNKEMAVRLGKALVDWRLSEFESGADEPK